MFNYVCCFCLIYLNLKLEIKRMCKKKKWCDIIFFLDIILTVLISFFFLKTIIQSEGSILILSLII